jgi:putative membrane protein
MPDRYRMSEAAWARHGVAVTTDAADEIQTKGLWRGPGRSLTMNGGEDPRVRFAAERTLLAWIRTGLALMGFGFVLARFSFILREVAAVEHKPTPESPGLSMWLGTALVVVGVGINGLAAAEHWRILQRLNRQEQYLPPRWSLPLMAAIVMAVLGTVMAAYLVLFRE